MGNFISLEGQRFGRLVVVERAENYEKFSKPQDRVLKYARWICKCDCGNITLPILATDLKSRSQVSCGCRRSETLRIFKTVHGMKGTKEYLAWKGMKDRCYNTNCKNYFRYGGRGVRVQDSWLNNFSSFFSHIGPAPTKSHSVDRIDSNGDYCEGNVRWATPHQQSHNTRKKSNGQNKYKWVHLDKNSGKFKALFVMDGVKHNKGLFEDEHTAARTIYLFYKELTGGWPKYCDDALIELGLIEEINYDNP